MSKAQPERKPKIVFHLTVEYDDDIDTELLQHVGELIEKAREQGRPVKAQLVGFPPTIDLKV